MSYIHLTIEERTSIAHLHKQGVSLRQIAITIGRNVSTIKRELDRNYTPNKKGDKKKVIMIITLILLKKDMRKESLKLITSFNFLWKLFKL